MHMSIVTTARSIRPLWLTIPAGLALFAFLCDWIGFVLHGGESWQAIAYYPLAGGLAIAAASALPGFIDMLTLPNGIPRKTFVHMVFNLVIATLYGASLWLRLEEEVTTWPVILSCLATVLVCFDARRREGRERPAQPRAVLASSEKQAATASRPGRRLPVHA